MKRARARTAGRTPVAALAKQCGTSLHPCPSRHAPQALQDITGKVSGDNKEAFRAALVRREEGVGGGGAR